MGLNGLVVGLAPAVGPTLADWVLKQNFNLFGHDLTWRGIFILPLAIVAVALLLSPFIVKDVVDNKRVKLDMISLFLSILGFGSFLWGFTNVADKGWGDMTYVLAPIILGLLIIALFAYRQLRMDEPFLDISVFKNKQFLVTTIAVALSMMAMIGFAILAIGTVPFVYLTAATPNHFITLLYAVRMFGLGMIMMPLTASALSALPTREAAHGTAANNTVRQIASAIVVALASSVTQNIITDHKPAASLKLENPLSYASKTISASLDGFHASFALGLAFALMGIAVALLLRKGKIIEREGD
ncbi:hypothetical protein JCM5176_09970 [Streptococcus sobrinus]|nr:drug resistance transporter, EmrB/QacA family [Streptococcus sobrinus]